MQKLQYTRLDISTRLTYPAPTGEEDEDVQEELKGVKLFIKRGDKDFSSGILGHVKLLTHRKMSDERLGMLQTLSTRFQDPTYLVDF